MAYFPISHTVPQYEKTAGVPASGYVLKAYSSGTLNTISMATDSSGGTLAATITLNADGYPAVSGTIIIPYINEKYRLMLYATQAAADADTGPIWDVNTVPISGDLFSVTQTISTTTALDSSDNGNHLNVSGTITVTLPDVDVVGSGFVNTWLNTGTGIVTIDGDGAETVNSVAALYLYPGDYAQTVSDASNWSAGVSRKKPIRITQGFHATADLDEIPLNGDSIALTSGGTVNGAQYANVYAYLWDNLADGQAAVAGGRGASATADFNANKKITAPDYRDYALIGVSSGGSITTVGAKAGASTVVPTGSISINAVTLTEANLPSSVTMTVPTADVADAGTAKLAKGINNPDTTSIAFTSVGSGSSFTPTGSTTIDSTSIVQKSAGVYWYVNF